MKVLLALFLLMSVAALRAELATPSLHTKSPEFDALRISEYKQKCEYIKQLIVTEKYGVDCTNEYQHFLPTRKSQVKNLTNLKIANYNLLHPGTSKALFKDNALVASIINRYDVVAALELLGTVGRDEQNNKAVISFITESPLLEKKLRDQRTSAKDPQKIQEIDEKLNKLMVDRYKAYELYRAPGYLKILDELKKLDPSWGLILTPRGDSAIVGSVEELTGFFYRGSVASLIENPHCAEVASAEQTRPYACFITLDERFMGQDLLKHFARRPFMASFKSKQSTFTLVTSHMVFTYSGSDEDEKDLMSKTFGVESYKDLGVGINGANFARYAEVKNTLEFMRRYQARYRDNRIMLMADMNLVSNNLFWPEVLNSFPGSSLLINEPTTISPGRYLSNGRETNGVANDYDHFILNKDHFKECNDGEVLNYFKDRIYGVIESRYVVRQEVVGIANRNKSFDFPMLSSLQSDDSESSDGDLPPMDDPATLKLDYPLTPAGQSKMDRFANKFETYLLGLQTVKKNEIVQDDFQIADRMSGLRRRIFLRQLTNAYYHRFVQEVLSDHFPVSITCKI